MNQEEFDKLNLGFAEELHKLIEKYIVQKFDSESMMLHLSQQFRILGCFHVPCYYHMLGMLTHMVFDGIEKVHNEINETKKEHGCNQDHAPTADIIS